MNALVSIFDFTDYRSFLQAVFDANKRKNPDFSFRQMSQECGISSPNFFIQVINRKRNLAKVSARKMVSGLKLKKRETAYLDLLIKFDHAKTSVEKNYYFALISSFRSRSEVTRLHSDHYRLYTDWYNLVILQLADGKPVATEPSWYAKMVYPPIRPKQAAKSLALLEKMRLLRKTKNKFWKQSSRFYETDRELNSLAIRNFHEKMITLAGKALDAIPQNEREVSSLTVKMSAATYAKVKDRIQDFKEELMAIINEDRVADQVYQINFQLFPVSEKDG
ncbi:MAG: TIGR02147 family protein [Chitinivibrionales bacterium]|nr:TIGR02147 family protein [Chitinivibrionales bacterium]